MLDIQKWRWPSCVLSKPSCLKRCDIMCFTADCISRLPRPSSGRLRLTLTSSAFPNGCASLGVPTTLFPLPFLTMHDQWSSSGVSVHAAVAPRAGHKAAYFSMFHSPTSVDNRSVRLGRVVMFLITTACAVFVERGVVQWLVSCDVGAVTPPCI